jgi:hypothetical protein
MSDQATTTSFHVFTSIFHYIKASDLVRFHRKIRIYKTIILPVVLYECENLSLTLREEYRLRVFEDRVLRRIF